MGCGRISNRDEDGSGKLLNQFEINVESMTITVRDVIAERVFQEVDNYQAEVNQHPRLRVSHDRQACILNHEEEVSKALRAFEENEFFIMVDDRQIQNLDETVPLPEGMTVTFVRQVPIVAG